MEAKDGSVGFDFAGTYTKLIQHQLIECSLGDRDLVVEFIDNTDSVTVRETFDADAEHPVELQRAGWQAIIDRFKIRGLVADFQFRPEHRHGVAL